ncbi:MAG TPA: endo-1,4-beta-xylanase, partial [Bacteroidota bacterium]|nr:endo-1,4-beta-xylanase [Bacteroidota bacterium]
TGVPTIWDADSVTLVAKQVVVTSKAVFAASKSTIDFGAVTAGTLGKNTVSISNKGTDTLKVSAISSTNSLFTFSPATMAIAPSDSAVLSVTFTPVDTASQTGRLLFTNNGARATDTVLVKGKGLARPASLPIVTNGSFEASPVGVVTGTGIPGWLIQVADAATPAPVFEIVSDTVQQGSRALKVTVGGIGSNPWDVQLVADSLAVKPGSKYLYSVWAKADRAGAQVNFTVGNYSYSEYNVIRPATLTTQWQNYTMQFTVTDNQTFIRGPIHFGLSATSGRVIYIDNMRITDVNAGKVPVVVEAESGKRGSSYPVLSDAGVTYVSPSSTNSNLTAPADTSRIITYQVTFPDSGSYNLFARVRVGSGAYNDDSFFYGHGFGAKSDTAASDWYMVNGLAAAGFSDPAAYVDGPGTIGSSVWKWINLTKNLFPSKTDSFYVGPDNLTKTFQIAGREDGLDIDKLAFGKTWLYFTVKNLDSVQAGVASMLPIDSSAYWKGPALATGMSKFLGNAQDGGDAMYAKYWNQITPGNAGKWGSIAGSADSSTWNWKSLDATYNFAKANNLLFKDHCLVWGQQQPAWITAAGMDSAKQNRAVEQWIRMVGQRYPAIDMIDVVNEPLINHNPAQYRPALGGMGVTGWDWVIWAFQKARQYLPKTKLLLNDYGIINDNSSTTAYLGIINLLKARNLIDGIGVQGHRFELDKADTTTLKNNLDRLAATGLPIYISEFDLGNYDDSGTPDDALQLALYKKVFPILWKHPGVKGITLWGYVEGQMWQKTAYIVNADGTGRPAFKWLADYIKNNPTGVTVQASGIPSQYALEQNYPNPFNPTTTIRYAISKSSQVTLKVFDMLGREVETLVNTIQVPGQYAVTFNAQRLSSGM